MKPILYPSSATSFNNRGLGALSDAISCVVSEERNGEYELTMEYPVGGIHFDEIGDRAIICAIPSPYRTPQPFRIYSIESPLNGVVTIHAHHLSYDLSGIPVSPFTAGSCSQALSGLVNNSVVTNPFTTWTDKSVIGEYKLSVPTSFRACLGGQEGSILDVYGKGEYEFDKYSVKLHLSRGSDNGVKIAYGKNLIDFNMERNLETIVTGILPYWANIDEDDVVEGDIITIYDINNPAYLIDSGGAYLLDSDGKYLLVQNPFPFNNVLPLDLSSEFEEKPTKAQLKERTEKYIQDNGLGVPRVSIDVSFVQLEQTEEYKDLANLEACDLCDTVTVEFPLYGISAKAKIIRVETDVLLEKYNSVQIGDTRPTLADTLAHLEINSVTKTEMKAGSQKAADVINNTKGTFEWIDSDSDGENEGFTIYESEGVAFLRCTAGGIGLSQDGGLTYTNAITKYGVVASQLAVKDGTHELLDVGYNDNQHYSALTTYNPTSHTKSLEILSGSVRSHGQYVQGSIRSDLTMYDPTNQEDRITLAYRYFIDPLTSSPFQSTTIQGKSNYSSTNTQTTSKMIASLYSDENGDTHAMATIGVTSSGADYKLLQLSVGEDADQRPCIDVADPTISEDTTFHLYLRRVTIGGTQYYILAGT